MKYAKVYVLFVAPIDYPAERTPIGCYATLGAAQAAAQGQRDAWLYTVREFDVLGMIEEGDDDAR